jgi:hypothetical protein
MEHSGGTFKHVGSKKAPGVTSRDANVLLHTVLRLRNHRGICKKGVYRFKSFKEANDWMLHQLAESTLASRP